MQYSITIDAQKIGTNERVVEPPYSTRLISYQGLRYTENEKIETPESPKKNENGNEEESEEEYTEIHEQQNEFKDIESDKEYPHELERLIADGTITKPTNWDQFFN